MIEALYAHSALQLSLVAGAILLAGLMRGFAGFGSGMVWIPLAALVIGPKLAAATLLILDTIIALPLIFPATKLCRWKSVVPAAIGAILAVSVGAWILANAPPIILHWGISIVVLALLAVLMSNWTYSEEPSRKQNLSVGALSGLLGGFSQMPSIPIYTLWATGPHPQNIIRANMIVFIAIADVSAYASYAYNGLFTKELIPVLIIAGPIYLGCLMFGAKAFKSAPPTYFKWAAKGIIFLAAVVSLPFFHDL
ncbi:sulfite exporter TauE/SafE family protein [Pseudovibrio ascidiaceicola]|uniref:sulfite exporter TauE/SafE family protein n=1 Tax=Pseudovibrio ascidiaceicola TaxID=285279 RepID=UPI000D699958|nr:sulfite exporter TauE/SafE family protein [Pseudovibrio ascidiaceicola]